MDKNVFDKYIIDKIKSIINENDINIIGRNAKEISKDIWKLDYLYFSEMSSDIYKKCEEEILYTLDRWDKYDIFNSMFDDAIQEDTLGTGAIGSYNWIDMVVMEKWTMNDLYKDIFENYLYHTFDSFIEQIIKEQEIERKEEQEMETTELKETENKEEKNNNSFEIFDDYIVKEIKDVIETYKININNVDINNIIKEIMWYVETYNLAENTYAKCRDIDDNAFKDLFEELVNTKLINLYDDDDDGVFYYIHRMFEYNFKNIDCFYTDLIQIYLDSHFEKFIKIIKEETVNKNLSTLQTLVEKELKNYREKMLSNGALYIYDKTWEIQMYKNINDYIQSLSYKKFNEYNKEEILRLCELNDGELIFENLFDKISKSAKTFIYYNVNVKKELDKIFIKDNSN